MEGWCDCILDPPPPAIYEVIMKRLITTVLGSRLLASNALMVGGSTFASVGAYLYHLLMGRMLTATDYGILQSLISLSNIVSVPLVTLSTTMVRIVANLVGKGEEGEVAYLHRRLSRFFWRALIVGGGTFFLFKDTVLTFLHIDSLASFIFLDIAFFFGFLQVLNRSILQGLSRFAQFVGAHIMESYGKLLLGVVLIFFGFRAPGAFGAFVLAGALTYLYTEAVLRRVLVRQNHPLRVSLRTYVGSTWLSFLMTISIISLFNVDVVLVRHFLSAQEAGLYAALSVLGKIIYFGSAPIANTMLPLVSEAHARGEGFHRTFLTSFGLTALAAGGVVLIYSLFPVLSLTILIGPQYVAAAQYLMSFSLFLSLCALVNLVAFFFFSIHKPLPIYLMPLAALVQAGLITFYHRDIDQVIRISVGVVSSLFAALLLYYLYVVRQKIAFRDRARLSAGANRPTRHPPP